MTTTPRVAKPMGRLHHIDSLRAYAILMMLQGHFVDTLINPAYRIAESPVYQTWMFCKGFTAPIFFTVTGLVLIYLLFRKEDPEYRESRARKAFRRGFQLIFWGYLLRANFLGMMIGQIYREFWKVDVLHCIGIGLIVLSGLYYITRRLPVKVYSGLLLSGGVLIFLLEPVYMAIDYSHWPSALSNYLTRANGSVFTPLPWIGYAMIGGFLATLYHSSFYKKVLGVRLLPLLLIATGLLLSQRSSWLLMQLHFALDIEVFKQVAYNNYLFIRLGHVFLFISGFIVLEKILARLHLFNEIGRSTLNIYIIHFVLLYGSWFGIGLSSFFARSLPPQLVIPGALMFILVVTYLALNVDQFKVWLARQKFVLDLQGLKLDVFSKVGAFLSGLPARVDWQMIPDFFGSLGTFFSSGRLLNWIKTIFIMKR